jgi:uncharacterized protein
MLFQLGAVQFSLAPMTIHDISFDTGHDFAAKDIIGAARPRESMGEADSKISLSGRVFPHFFARHGQDSGLSGLATLEDMSRSGEPQMLVGGDGTIFGFYLIEKLRQKNTFIDTKGIGRQIDFDIDLVKSPIVPDASALISTLSAILSLFG